MRRFLTIITCFALGACQTTQNTAPIQKFEAKPVSNWQYGAMVASANPMATQAGVDIIEKGGSAIDAAIAVQSVLSLVEPQSSGIGGGAFMLYFDAKTGDVQTYDGRETAPMGAKPDMFMQDGKPMEFWTAVKSGHSTGVPGVIAMPVSYTHLDVYKRQGCNCTGFGKWLCIILYIYNDNGHIRHFHGLCNF